MKRFIKSFSFALNGLWSAFLEQRNIKIHFFITVSVVGLGFYVNLNLGEWIVITTVIGLVWVAELFNTAVEYLVNLISPQLQSAAGKIKDIAAGAVLIAAITAIVVGVLIFKGHIHNA